MNTGSSDPSSPHGDITVPADLKHCDPLISKTLRALEACKWDHNGLVWPHGTGVLTVKVSRDAMHRALRIFQAILTGVESRGWKIKPNTEKGQCAVKIGEDELAIRLREKLKRSKNQSSHSSWTQYDLNPTGLLMLEINTYVGRSGELAWWDTKTWPLEKQIVDILDGFADAAESLRQLNMERAEEEKRREKEEAKREALQKRENAERRLRDELFAHLGWYERSIALGTLIQDVSKRQLPASWSEEARTRWLNWAKKIREQLDPFSNGYFSKQLSKATFEPGFQWPKPEHETWEEMSTNIPTVWP